MLMSDIRTKRRQWVDIAKGIAIIAVVLGHVTYSYSPWKLLPISVITVWLWHVPVFFLIGGFFVKEERLQNLVSFVKGKLKSLYLPILYIYLPVLFLHNWFIKIGFYGVDVEYYGKYVTEWEGQDFLRHVVEALLFAGREPLLGAMWFVYVLFMALCCLSIVSWSLRKCIKEDQVYEYVRFVVLLLGAVLSCTMTKLYDVTIPRFSNMIVAVWLLYIGMLLVQKRKVEFNNKYVALISVVIAYHAATTQGGVNFAANLFSEVVSLTANSVACLYLICFISKRIEGSLVGKILSKAGEDSFYIMCLHFFGFKVFSLILLGAGMSVDLADLCPHTGCNILLLFGYLFFGVIIPLAFIAIYRRLYRRICKTIKM